jgi:hypothetical protein
MGAADPGNRTAPGRLQPHGPEKKLDFTGAESLFVKQGKKLLSYWSERSAVLTFDLDLKEMLPLSSGFSIDYLSRGTV